jgi:regulator of RNase E activity RraA
VTEPLGHQALIRPRLLSAPPHLDDWVYRRLRQWPSEDVSDAVGRLYTMDSGIRPLYTPITRVAGPAVTVRLPPADNWALAMALSQVGPGDVLVVDWMGYRDGCGSGINAIIPAIRTGLAGIVIDGSWRDVAELRQLGLPVFGRGISPFSPSKQQEGEINVPACCGGVIVEPGDVVVADEGGVAVVPRRHAEEISKALPEDGPPVRRTIDDYPAAPANYTRRVRAYQERFGGGQD